MKTIFPTRDATSQQILLPYFFGKSSYHDLRRYAFRIFFTVNLPKLIFLSAS